MHKYMTVTMNDGSLWGVPVDIIARDRAKYYAHEFDGDIERSLKEDTIPLFEASTYNIEDWAVGNMNWSDFEGEQVKLRDALPLTDEDFQNAWNSNQKGYSE